MKKKRLKTLFFAVLTSCLLVGCGSVADNKTNIPTPVESVDQITNEDMPEISIVESGDNKEQNSEQEDAIVKEAEVRYQAGRAALYGLDGTPIDFEDAYMNFEKARELGKVEANFYLGVLCDWCSYPEQSFEKAKIYYEACGDNPYAQISLGFLYYYGQGVDKDEEKARELFQGAIDRGYPEGYLGMASIEDDVENYALELEYDNKVLSGTEELFIRSAMNDIGLLYTAGLGVEQNYNIAMEWYVKAADLGEPSAMYLIGYLYEAGLGVNQDYTKAMEWYVKAADQGDSDAMNSIGDIYIAGLGVKLDYEKAMEWYVKAADLGDPDAMCLIGYLYIEGLGVNQDYIKAKEWYEKAAELGNKYAMHSIGWIYYNGWGVNQDYTKAMEWYVMSADLGNAAAMSNIGYLYEHGLGVNQDYTKAMEWYVKAADLGEPSAMNNIGAMYENGLGVNQDYVKAMEWYVMSADLGDAPAMSNIGYMYENGLGVNQDYTKALEWYDKAAELGNEIAEENARLLRQKMQ